MRWDQTIVEEYITGSLHNNEESPIHLHQTHQRVKQNTHSSRLTATIGKSSFCQLLDIVTKRLDLLANHVDRQSI